MYIVPFKSTTTAVGPLNSLFPLPPASVNPATVVALVVEPEPEHKARC